MIRWIFRTAALIAIVYGLAMLETFFKDPAPPPAELKSAASASSSAYYRTSTPVQAVRAVSHTTTSVSYVLVTRVIDGDTVQISTGQKVRYIGVNSPESVDPRRSVQCFGLEASDYNKKLVEGKKVKFVKDVSDTDKYGRLLRYVYLEDGTFVNLALVKNGYASASTFPPDVKFANTFKEAEREARENQVGLWGACR